MPAFTQPVTTWPGWFYFLPSFTIKTFQALKMELGAGDEETNQRYSLVPLALVFPGFHLPCGRPWVVPSYLSLMLLVPGSHWFGRPCSGSLLEFPSATYCPCPETSLSSSGSHWFGHLDSCSGLPCSGPLSWIPPFLPSLVDHVISPVWTPLLLPVPGSCRLLQVGHVPAMRATTGKGGQ